VKAQHQEATTRDQARRLQLFEGPGMSIAMMSPAGAAAASARAMARKTDLDSSSSPLKLAKAEMGWVHFVKSSGHNVHFNRMQQASSAALQVYKHS
jgi:hypothetical protein